MADGTKAKRYWDVIKRATNSSSTNANGAGGTTTTTSPAQTTTLTATTHIPVTTTISGRVQTVTETLAQTLVVTQNDMTTAYATITQTAQMTGPTQFITTTYGALTIVVEISQAPTPTTSFSFNASNPFNFTFPATNLTGGTSTQSSQANLTAAVALPTALNGTTTKANERNSGDNLSGGDIAGITIGSAAGLVILALVALFAFKRWRRNNQDGELEDMMAPTRPDPYMDEVPGSSVGYSQDELSGPMMRHL